MLQSHQTVIELDIFDSTPAESAIYTLAVFGAMFSKYNYICK